MEFNNFHCLLWIHFFSSNGNAIYIITKNWTLYKKWSQKVFIVKCDGCTIVLMAFLSDGDIEAVQRDG